MSGLENSYRLGEVKTSCALCGCAQIIPTRSGIREGDQDISSPIEFFDWARRDDFGDDQFAHEYNQYLYGVTLDVASDGFIQPHAAVFAEEGRRRLCVVPDFGITAHWVCEHCKGKLPEPIRSELPPVDIVY